MRFSIYFRFFFSLITLVVISLMGMGIVLLQDADKRLDEFMFLQAKSQARTLARSSEEALLVSDYPLLENLVNVSITEEHYANAAIIKPSGKVVSHTDLKKIGRDMWTVSEKDVYVREQMHDGVTIKEIIHPIWMGDNYLANAHIAYYTDKKSSIADETITWLSSIVIFTLIFIALGSVIITRQLTRPIMKLTQTVYDGNERLDIDTDILRRTDEVGALARAFKGMSDQLVDRLEELELQIRERDQARAANETKNAFLANVSHELRTPLNAIIGYSELLVDWLEDDGRNEYIGDVEKITNSARHLTILINDMLDLSKIEAGKMDVEIKDIYIQNFVPEILEAVQPLVRKNNNKLLFTISRKPHYVMADPLRLKQVLLNLLSNAAKFTKNGEVKLDIGYEEDFAVFTIRDSGIGMTAEQLEKIFDAFTQASTGTSRKYGGTGLGLTISKKLCQMMGGGISVASEPNRGSVFKVTIPAKLACKAG